jgi:hypothetical protein
MFKVYFCVGENYVSGATLPFLPRKGEKIKLCGTLYQVIGIMYKLEEGSSNQIEVVIALEKF